jgi:hypothetical protein
LKKKIILHHLEILVERYELSNSYGNALWVYEK